MGGQRGQGEGCVGEGRVSSGGSQRVGPPGCTTGGSGNRRRGRSGSARGSGHVWDGSGRQG
jgi:hypothetical protein